MADSNGLPEHESDVQHDTTSVDSVELDDVVDDDSNPSSACAAPAMASLASASSSCSSSFSDDEIDTTSCHDENQSYVIFHDLHSAISKNHGSITPLKREAISLLQQASRHVVKSRKRIKLSTNRHMRVSMASLYDQLESLRKLIPRSKQGTPDHSCIILATLQHLEDMRKEIRELEERIKLSNPNIPLPILSHTFTRANQVQVKRLAEGNTMKITVNCRKRRGLMSDLIFSIESIDLLLDSMRVSCNDGLFSFQAMASPQLGHNSDNSIGEEAVKEAILKVIFDK